MQLQAIKQNSGKQCNASDMRGKAKVGAENGAMQEKMQVGTQNKVNAKGNKASVQNIAKVEAIYK